jgi:probable rRNA maturation factor
LKIKVFYDNIDYRIKDKAKTIKLIERVIRSENKIPGDLYFIITNDNELIKINKEFLRRNSFTDVITFDYSNKEIINGEIYISINAVKRNAHNYKVSLYEELKRVMIHGILHLMGYKDKKKKEKEKMTELEDLWLRK